MNNNLLEFKLCNISKKKNMKVLILLFVKSYLSYQKLPSPSLVIFKNLSQKNFVLDIFEKILDRLNLDILKSNLYKVEII